MQRVGSGHNVLKRSVPKPNSSGETLGAHTVRCARAVWLTQEPPGGVGARPASRCPANKRLADRSGEGYVRGSWAYEMCSANGVGLPTVREHGLRTFFGGPTRDD